MPKLSLEENDRITMNTDLERYSYYALVFQIINNVINSPFSYIICEINIVSF